MTFLHLTGSNKRLSNISSSFLLCCFRLIASITGAGPTCNCNENNSTSNNLTCSVTYADASFNPIYAKVTWTADGSLYKIDTLNVRTKVNNAFTSTSTITVGVNDPRTFQCNLTFTKPQSVSAPYIATNAPAFSAICNPNCEMIGLIYLHT